MKTWFITSALLLLPALASAQDSPSRVEIECHTGKLRVGPGPSVVAEGMKHTRSGALLRLTANTCPADIKLPVVDLNVVVQTGAVEITGRYGRIEVHIASGRLQIDAHSPDIEAQTLSGRIEIQGQAEAVRAETVSGNIEVGIDRAERVRAQATNGRIQISAPYLARHLEAETVNGRITLQGKLQERSDIRAKSMSGKIDAELSADAGYSLQAQSYSGKVEHRGERVRGTLRHGDGSSRVRLQSFSGAIDVK